VNTDCGEEARLVGVIFVEDLPKTRSGNIIRHALKEIMGICSGTSHVGGYEAPYAMS